jgi:hypothetical protein
MSKLGVVLGFTCALPFANSAAAALASAQCPQDIVAELKACASIGAPTDSLSCFNRLAERAAASPIAPSAAPGGAAAPPVSQASPSVVPRETFGLYAAEHPVAPKTQASHTAKIVELGVSRGGRPTVTLEGGEQWQLDAADPLLADGNTVIITRGTFGSFLMTTPTGRTHRVQRIQ